VVGLAQYRIKRLLAFSTISHVGFMLLALSVNSEESITSFLFYLMQYSITNLNAFFVLLAFGYVMRKGREVSFISQLKGQFQANPVLGLSLALCLFSMAGIPPLVGFFAKYRVLYSAIENGYYFLAIVGILASVVSAAYYLRVIRVIHFDASGPEREVQASMSGKNPVLVSSTHSFIIAVLTLFILLFIVSPSLLLNSSNLLALSLFSA
jgi:NADH-ubiquinone oxidoreductase chain 2